ncbi:MAG: host specificity factor TipJ family phage tail protein [Bermanella sp.]
MSVEIRVYPNKLVTTEYEALGCDAGLTVEQWLIGAVPGYERLEVPLYSVCLNGLDVPADLWPETVLTKGALLEFFVEPKEAVTIAMVVIAVVSAAAAIYYANKIPDNYNSTTPNGSPIYDANAQGNKVRLMGTVPEHFGRHLNYPDVLNRPRQHYQNDESWKYFFMCVGQGEYQINDADIVIGNTSIDRYAADIEYQVFAPGENVSGHEAHRNFYEAVEVGGSGLEVDAPLHRFVAEQGSDRYIQAGIYYSSIATPYGLKFHVASGNTYHPPWPLGSHIQLNGLGADTEIFEGVVDLVDMGGANADQIVADFGLNVAAIGDRIQLVGVEANNGSYLIKAVSDTVIELTDLDGNDVTWLVPAERVLIRLLRDDPLLGLYRIESTNSLGIVVSKVGDAAWAGFVGQYKYYDITAELVDGSINPVAIGAFTATPVGETTNLIELDFNFDGLGRLNDNGSVSTHSVDIEISWRETGTAAWTNIPHTFTAATRDQFGRTIVVNLPSKMAVEVQVERVSHEEDSIRLSEKVVWTGLRAELDTAVSYPGWTTLALKIKGTNVLASSSENKINVIATRKLLTFDANGDFTQFQATTDIAPAFYHMCLSAGYTADQIDLVELYRLHQTWSARGDEFNAIFDNEITIWEALKRVLNVGFAKPTLDFGQIIPVRDEPRQYLNYMYQADNMVKGSWKMSATLIDEAEKDGVEVEYFSLETRKPETILCLLPGEAGLNPEKSRAFGITDRDKAYQFGMRRGSERRYRRVQHTWSTEMDGLNSNYLSYDALGIDIPGFSQTGRVENVSGRVIKVNLDLEFLDEAVNYMGIRRPDGTLSGPYICTQGAALDEVVLAEDLDFSPQIDGTQEPPLFMFGADSQWCERVLVTGIKPQGTDKVRLTAINYDERVFDYDDAVAPV